MGFLDCLAGIMQIFAATYLPGSLIVLLTQSAIPISMVRPFGSTANSVNFSFTKL